MTTTVSVYNPATDESTRITLGAPAYSFGKPTHSGECGAGLFSIAIWIGRKYVVEKLYSQWVTRDGRCTGDTFRLLDRDDLGRLARMYGKGAADRAAKVLGVVTETIDGQAVGT